MVKTTYKLAIFNGVKASHGTLLNKKKITICGMPGFEIKESVLEGQTVIKSRFVLKGSFFINIMVMSTPENYDNKPMNDFMNSFKLVSKLN